jgi:FkbM family methyltransferase
MGLITPQKFLIGAFSGHVKPHFGQWGEDVLIRKLFPKNKVNGKYVDIGAYHPFKHSNTAGFWMRGWTGINIDANKHSIELFKRKRPKDVNLWSAVVPHKTLNLDSRCIDLYMPYKNNISTIGTVDIDLSSERSFTEKVSVPATSIPLLTKEYDLSDVDYVNIDVEGLDTELVKDMDFIDFSPTVISVEDYSPSLTELLTSEISRHLLINSYELVARAGPTSIFIKK